MNKSLKDIYFDVNKNDPNRRDYDHELCVYLQEKRVDLHI